MRSFLILSRLQSGTETVVRLDEALAEIAAEREACAKICDDLHEKWKFGEGEESRSGPKECAEAIRRLNKDE